MNQSRRTDPPPSPAAGDGFGRFGRHRLRTPNGAIVELPVPIAPDSEVWVATIWPDHAAVSGGWQRQLWRREPTGRGWILPLELAGCDVVEFGADTPAGPVRWYGTLCSYLVECWTILQGPYRCPDDAWNDAQRLLTAVRHDHLVPEQADPVVIPHQAVSRPERCRRHHPIRQSRGSRPS